MTHSTRRAFTLIELLIVVAIIAILAAIAVPNFLEAQVRAKVARTSADLRTLATGIEAYAVDQNKYPIYAAFWSTAPGVYQVQDPATTTGNDYFEYLCRNPRNSLSTPVAYVSTISQDPFATKYTGQGPEPEVRDYAYKQAQYNAQIFAGPPEPWLGPGGSQFIADWGHWRLVSAGPDLIRTEDIKVNRVYDATNGTLSRGDIVRSQRKSESRPK